MGYKGIFGTKYIVLTIINVLNNLCQLYPQEENLAMCGPKQFVRAMNL